MDRLAAIIRWLSGHPKSTAGQIAHGTGLEPEYTEEELERLRRAGFVTKEGLVKGPGYSVAAVQSKQPPSQL